jgi:hypothetical protein
MGRLKPPGAVRGIMQFRKKPIVIDAIQWDGNNTGEVLTFCKMNATLRKLEDGITCAIIVETLESNQHVETRHCASIGDYICKGVKGEFYPCKPDIFEVTYEKVE